MGTSLAQDFTPERMVAAQTLAAANVDGPDRRAEYAYDAAHRLTSATVKVPGGTDVVTTDGYTGDSRVPSPVTGPALAGAADPAVTAIASAEGLVTPVTDPDGVVTAYGYDTATRRRTSATVAPGTADAATTTYTYTPEGWLASVRSPPGHVTAYDYDGAGRTTLRRDPDGAEWRTEYDPAGRVSATVDPLGNRAESRYDPATGRLVERVDERGKSTRYRNSAAGELTAVIAPDDDADAANDPTTRCAYGPLGRLTSVTDPAGVVKRCSHDADGRVSAVTDGDGNAWRTTYWPDGQVRPERTVPRRRRAAQSTFRMSSA